MYIQTYGTSQPYDSSCGPKFHTFWLVSYTSLVSCNSKAYMVQKYTTHRVTE